jgi:2-polyprenyl-6-methoxyphenol hydroxylase-like FAD-dependent oxidoreductase
MSSAKHAIVVGGSVAGLCAARVLADVFDKVTVLDRDSYPEDAKYRKGVPQSRHPHALLDGGRRRLERLFPGFDKKMLGGGALELDPGLNMAVLRADGWAPRRKTPHTLLFSSRVLIESVIRELCTLHENVRFVERAEVTRLVSTGSPQRVCGVGLREDGGEETELAADLVVDASGRETHSVKWLAELGLSAPEQSVVNADSGYSTRWYQGPIRGDRPEEFWWSSLWIEPIIDADARTEDKYFALLFPVEGDRWIITTASWGGRELARDPESFDRIISNLRSPALADALKNAEPITPVYTRRGMKNSWRHYERWSVDLPGFISTGDATCGFNPVYGQGMTSAACCALVLEKCLKKEDPTTARFARRFFRAQAKFLSTPWMMATSRDLQQAKVVDGEGGRRPNRIEDLIGRAMTFYFTQIALAGAYDPNIGARLFEVINLSIRPTALIADPRILGRVIWARLRQRLTPPPQDRERMADHPPAPALE